MKQYERSLRQALYLTFKPWRFILITALLLALLLGGFKFLTGWRKLPRTEADRAAALQKLEEKRDAYRAEGQALAEKCDRVKTQYAEYYEYIWNSYLMGINTLKIEKVSAEFYIGTEAAEDPAPEAKGRLFTAYDAYLHNGELYRYLFANTELFKSDAYVGELIDSELHEDAASITVSVVAGTKADAELLMGLIKQGLNRKAAEFSAEYLPNTLTVANEDSICYADTDLAEYQRMRRQLLATREEEIEETDELYTAWKKKGLPKDTVTRSGLGQSMAKWAAVGFAGGLLLALFLSLCYAFFTRRLTGEEYWNEEDIAVLGTVGKAKHNTKFDRWLKKVFDIGANVGEPKAEKELVLARIKTAMEQTGAENAALVGTAKLNDAMSLIDTTVFLGDVAADAETALSLEGFDSAVIVAKDGRETVTHAKETAEAVAAAGKKLLGVILVR